LREYSFFRKTSNTLLKRFFDHHKALKSIEWNGRTENEVQDIYQAYIELPAKVKSKIEDDLENLNDVSSQKGMPCLVDAAASQGVKCKDISAYNLAMTLFLDCREAFDIAHEWWTINHFQSYTDFRGRKPHDVKDPEAGKPHFEAAFSEFLDSMSKGIDIHVDVYNNANKIAYVVCHEDYVKPIERFRNHKLQVLKDKPVFYATIVYYPKLGKLKVKAAKNDVVEFTRDAFAEHIIKKKDFFQHADVKLIYDLNWFKRPWRFETDPADHISRVKVVSIRFHPEPGSKDQIEVKSYDNLAQRLKDMNVDLKRAEINRVSLCFKFPGIGRAGSKTVNLSMPNHNNLSDSENDQLIERYLVDWEIANM